MEGTVLFREFEERDIDFIYRCKNDDKLNEMIVGQYHPFTYEEAAKWVHGCMGEHETYKFWAVCTADSEQRIIGWIALSHIDTINSSCETHSIVIGDHDYRDGFAWVESVLFMFEYAFVELGLNRVYGQSLIGNQASNLVEGLMFMTREGISRQSVYKNNRFYDVSNAAILKDEYFYHKSQGDYEMSSILRRLRKLRKESK